VALATGVGNETVAGCPAAVPLVEVGPAVNPARLTSEQTGLIIRAIRWKLGKRTIAQSTTRLPIRPHGYKRRPRLRPALFLEAPFAQIQAHMNTKMNSALRYITFCAAGAMLCLSTGCNTVSTSIRQDLGGPTYPPSNPALVQILRAAPTRAHVRLGEVQAEPSSDSMPVTEIEAALRKAAAKMGADAAVVVYDRTQTTGAYVTGPWWGRSVQTVQGRVIIAVAIKYK
jgi:hypothetical protein